MARPRSSSIGLNSPLALAPARMPAEPEGHTRRGEWQARDLAARRYVYVWADGVYL